MADMLKKLRDIPPGDSEDQGIKEYQNQVNALAAPVATAAPPVEPGPPELVNPLTRYGSRQGEHRYTVDENGNLTTVVVPQDPVALPPRPPATAAPVAAPARLKPIVPQSLQQPMPVYDNGGDVKAQPSFEERIALANPVQLPKGYEDAKPVYDKIVLPKGYEDAQPVARYGEAEAVANRPAVAKPTVGMKPMPLYDNGGDVKVPEDHKMTVKAEPLKPEDYLSRYGSEAAVANRPEASKPTTEMKPMPLYDDGGDVDVNDGKHQVAILQDGEKVLTPEEAEQYKAEHTEKSPASKEAAPAEPGMQEIYMPHVENPEKVQDKLQQKQM